MSFAETYLIMLLCFVVFISIPAIFIVDYKLRKDIRKETKRIQDEEESRKKEV